jgi:hypothetical protein
MAKPASSRLGDVLLPLAQIVAHVAPDRLPGFLALARQLEAEQRGDRALSWEASVATALADLRDQVSNGMLLIGALAEHINADRPEKEQFSNKRIGDVLRSLGVEVRKTGGNKAAAVWDRVKVEALAEHYAEPAVSEGEGKTSGISEGEGSEDANNANQANPGAAVDPDSVVSVVSVGRGDAPEETEEFPGDQANPRPGRTPPECGAEELRGELLAIGERLNRQQTTLGAVTIPAGQSAWERAAHMLPPNALKHAVEAGRALLIKLEKDDKEDLVF